MRRLMLLLSLPLMGCTSQNEIAFSGNTISTEEMLTFSNVSSSSEETPQSCFSEAVTSEASSSVSTDLNIQIILPNDQKRGEVETLYFGAQYELNIKTADKHRLYYDELKIELREATGSVRPFLWYYSNDFGLYQGLYYFVISEVGENPSIHVQYFDREYDRPLTIVPNTLDAKLLLQENGNWDLNQSTLLVCSYDEYWDLCRKYGLRYFLDHRFFEEHNLALTCCLPSGYDWIFSSYISSFLIDDSLFVQIESVYEGANDPDFFVCAVIVFYIQIPKIHPENLVRNHTIIYESV